MGASAKHGLSGHDVKEGKLSNSIRKIRRNILQAVTGSRTFKHRTRPFVHGERPQRKEFYAKVEKAAKSLRGGV